MHDVGRHRAGVAAGAWRRPRTSASRSSAFSSAGALPSSVRCNEHPGSQAFDGTSAARLRRAKASHQRGCIHGQHARACSGSGKASRPKSTPARASAACSSACQRTRKPQLVVMAAQRPSATSARAASMKGSSSAASACAPRAAARRPAPRAGAPASPSSPGGPRPRQARERRVEHQACPGIAAIGWPHAARAAWSYMPDMVRSRRASSPMSALRSVSRLLTRQSSRTRGTAAQRPRPGAWGCRRPPCPACRPAPGRRPPASSANRPPRACLRSSAQSRCRPASCCVRGGTGGAPAARR
jgi:hypothetical protein